jgi:hypothetical protein
MRATRQAVSAIVLMLGATSCFWNSAPGSVSAGPGTRYADPTFGWSVAVPPGFQTHAFSVQGRGTTAGASVGNFTTDAVAEGNGLGSFRSFPDGGVLFMFWHNEGGVVGVNTDDDTALPLSMTDYTLVDPYVGGSEPRPHFASVIEGGAWFASAVWIGPNASQQDRAAIEGVVASFEYPHLRPLSVTAPSQALVLGSTTDYPVGSVTAFPPDALSNVAGAPSDFGSPLTDVGLYLVHGAGGFYAVPMQAQAPGQERSCALTAHPASITFSCANGAIWDRRIRAVSPPANQGEMHGFSLFVAPTTTSWDGYVLVGQGNAPQMAVDAWAPGT